MMDGALPLVWFGLLGVLLAGYAILDGFDLGVGMVHLFVARDDAERRIVLNSIGPIWDGNEVWLVTFGGALFAAFPEAYATLFSGFYAAFMLLIFCLMLRAVSIEFRGKRIARFWRRLWDAGFTLGSFAASLLFGVAVGNLLQGVPLDAAGEYHGELLAQLSPYPLLVGALVVTLFLMHGAVFLSLKTEGALHLRVRRWAWRGFGLFLVAFLLTTIFTLATFPHAIANFARWPLLWGIPVVLTFALADVPREIFHERPRAAFLASTVVIASLVALLGAAMYPDLIHSWPAPGHSLTLWNAASSPHTLRIMLLIAAIGMPAVLAYTAIVYWTFRGKTRLGEHSY
jgi:cytochrome d ubiquinol oxidase subunit II